MADTTTSGFGPGLYDDGRKHPVWNSFSNNRRRSLIDEDLEASRSVAAVLLTIVTFGVLLGLTGVLIVCL
ncbi:MAG: hypothetical protein WD875_01275 [Pirellulales bacterium]